MSVYKKSARKSIIAVAMSGGVDSSVAAALLKKQGYNVVGFFMKNWGDTFGLKDSGCPWIQDRKDALRAAAKLDIPFYTLDFEEEYKRRVLSYFFKEYQAGRTPNPDVMCNSVIKFGVFLDKAMELGADYIATGHYARLLCHPRASGDPGLHASELDSRVRGNDSRVCQLLKSKDKNKDQTYFLYRLNQSQLIKAVFPIGDYTKPEVRKLAKNFGLPNHDKRDSQGLCFIGQIDLRKFLSQKIKDKPGKIVTVEGQAVGEHQGLFGYTIGQRKGIAIGGIGPFYVAEKDLKNNQLIVTHDAQDQRLYKTVVEFNDVNWIAGRPPLNPLMCQGRIRYRESLVECKIKKIDSPAESAGGNDNPMYRATFAAPVRAVAAGQSVVFYDKEVCLGGGIINLSS